MSDVCEFAECVETKKGFKTMCELSGQKCHTNHLDKTWCKDWEEEQDRIKKRS